jgi:predicted RND superfamily exporter protein
MMGLLIFGAPFGFMAFLGIASLGGVIVSHIIVLFDYIEEMHEHGESLHRAVIDAALVRLRPVLVTVLATVGGLIPLAIEGGPLWQPMCYVQIVGLLVATLVTKVIVPVLYVVFVENLKIIRWESRVVPERAGVGWCQSGPSSKTFTTKQLTKADNAWSGEERASAHRNVRSIGEAVCCGDVLPMRILADGTHIPVGRR